MITWNPDLVAFSIGSVEVRWYSLMWCIGLAIAYYVVYRLYKDQNIPEKKFDPLFLYCFLGILIGARLGHCLLYEPEYFLAHPMEMFLPIRYDAAGDWHFTGYAGLASHGGTAGIIIALWIYVKRQKVNFIRVIDNIAVATPITACCIRLGNLMNSEIVGKYTNSDYGFVFERLGDTAPRHPGQLYEAIAYFVFFLVSLWLYKKYSHKIGTGFFFGLDILLIFTFRFFIEYTKEIQEAFEAGLPFDMGQLLSIPFIALGAYFTWRGCKLTVDS